MPWLPSQANSSWALLTTADHPRINAAFLHPRLTIVHLELTRGITGGKSGRSSNWLIRIRISSRLAITSAHLSRRSTFALPAQIWIWMQMAFSNKRRSNTSTLWMLPKTQLRNSTIQVQKMVMRHSSMPIIINLLKMTRRAPKTPFLRLPPTTPPTSGISTKSKCLNKNNNSNSKGWHCRLWILRISTSSIQTHADACLTQRDMPHSTRRPRRSVSSALTSYPYNRQSRSRSFSSCRKNLSLASSIRCKAVNRTCCINR